MSDTSVYRRTLRRELHRSRSLSASLALGVVAVGLAYAGTESVLAALELDPWLISPEQALEAVNTPSPMLIAGATAAVVFGVVLLVLAVTPGRRSRHSLPHDRLAIVVDDDVLAGALGSAARAAASVPDGRVHTTISARRANVSVIPSSGHPLDRTSIETAVLDLTSTLAPSPRIRPDVSIATAGVVGS